MVRKYYYDEPVFEPDEEGNIIIIHKYSIAPIESFTYGITKDKQFFLDWRYSLLGDDELERDYRIITKERLLNTLKNEIVILKNEGNTKLAMEYEKAYDLVK